MITGKELGEAVLKRVVVEHPESHDNNVWVDPCGTIACLAGWAVLLNREENEPPYTTLFRLAGGFDIPADWEAVAIRLLLPEGAIDPGWELDEVREELSNAFYTGGDNEEGVRQFARALGLDIPEA